MTTFADDDEPVSDLWLKTAGFKCDIGLYSATFGENYHLNLSYNGWGATLNHEDGDEIDIPLPQTRGEVRRLCGALGIAIRSGGEGGRG